MLPKGDVVGQRQFIHTLFGIAARFIDIQTLAQDLCFRFNFYLQHIPFFNLRLLTWSHRRSGEYGSRKLRYLLLTRRIIWHHIRPPFALLPKV